MWQGTLIAIVLLTALPRLKRNTPQLRYSLALLALLLLLAVPLITTTLPGSLIGTQLLEGAASVAAWPSFEWLAALWLGGVGILSLRLIGSALVAVRLRRRAQELAPPNVQLALLSLMGRLGMRRSVGLYLSQAIDTPMVVGWLKPAVLLLASALSGLSFSQLEAILAHELTHIRRYDPLVNAVQVVAEVLFFFHPAAWWFSRLIRREREHCCDDTAAALCGAVPYAQALA